jgi:hypothetical protein
MEGQEADGELYPIAVLIDELKVRPEIMLMSAGSSPWAALRLRMICLTTFFMVNIADITPA